MMQHIGFTDALYLWLINYIRLIFLLSNCLVVTLKYPYQFSAKTRYEESKRPILVHQMKRRINMNIAAYCANMFCWLAYVIWWLGISCDEEWLATNILQLKYRIDNPYDVLATALFLLHPYINIVKSYSSEHKRYCSLGLFNAPC